MPTFDLAASLDALPLDEQVSARARVSQVHAAQRLQGMQPRNDSLLTFRYAVGEIEDIPSAIANELVIVDKIHKNTRYCELIEHVMRIIAFKLKTKYNMTWTDAWTVTRFYVPSMLKFYCIKTTPNWNDPPTMVKVGHSSG